MARGIFYIELIFQIHRLYQLPISKEILILMIWSVLSLELYGQTQILNYLKWQVSAVEISKSKAFYGDSL